MKTTRLQKPELPTFLPHGWISEVAKSLGVCRATVSRNIMRGNGLMYDNIVKAAAAKYGETKEMKL
jgi:IS30 family transposase